MAKFPDLTGDGKVTQADILKGRKVFQKGGDSGKSAMQKAVEKMTMNKAATILANKNEFSKEEVKVAEAKVQLEKVKSDSIKRRPKEIPSFAQDTTASPETMKKLRENKERYFEKPQTLKKAEMMYGGVANKKKHNYTAGGSVQDNLGVMIAVGKLKPKKKNGSKTT
tara:strand:+ start:1642 stop:2142 length:501 start_codon:yes stop_codon:yes gene_type:complete